MTGPICAHCGGKGCELCAPEPRVVQRTKDRLAQALREAGAPAEMIEKAEAGAYDDFESESATPIQDLTRDCARHRLVDISYRAMRGDFDCTPEEAAAWVQSPEGQATLAELPWRRP